MVLYLYEKSTLPRWYSTDIYFTLPKWYGTFKILMKFEKYLYLCWEQKNRAGK